MVGFGVNALGNLGSMIPKSSESERSESERNGDLTEPGRSQVHVMVPDPEVSSSVGRRRFSASYKASIVRKADACLESGEIGVLLRREGLYSSHLTHWRREYRQGAELALADNKRGRKCTKLAVDLEVEKLRLQLERTEKKLKQAEMVIEFQKKLCEILGISPPSVSKGGE